MGKYWESRKELSIFEWSNLLHKRWTGVTFGHLSWFSWTKTIVGESYPIVRVSYQVFHLSYRENHLSGFAFIVYQVIRLSFIRFCVYQVSVYLVNRNASPFSWSNTRKTQRSPTFCFYCWVIQYCGLFFIVTIRICFLKQ